MRYTEPMNDPALDEVPASRTTARLLAEVKGLNLGDRMWPDEILEADRFLAHYRSFELPTLSALKKTGANLVLRRVERKVAVSRRFIVDRFCGDPNRKGDMPHNIQPTYVGQAWWACRDWLMAREGRAGVERLGLGIWQDLLAETMRYVGSDDALEDVLTLLRGQHSALVETLPGAVPAWAQIVLNARWDMPRAEAALDILIEQGASLEGVNLEGKTALILAAEQLDSGILGNRLQAEKVLLPLLDREAAWEDKAHVLPRAAWQAIEQHAGARRKRLREIAQQARQDEAKGAPSAAGRRM